MNAALRWILAAVCACALGLGAWVLLEDRSVIGEAAPDLLETDPPLAEEAQ